MRDTSLTDKALEDAAADKLGFGTISHHLASAFLQNDLSRGFVVGVEGPWGSGKSSLIKMALNEVRDKTNGPKVVNFAPWLVGSRNELLLNLFSELEPIVIELLPEADKKDTKAIFARYAQAATGLAALAELADIGGLPWAGKIAQAIRASGKKAAELSESSLGELNDKLREKLKKLKRPIVVFVDDLDRLDPNEVVEVLRLIKAVADFPNVAYVLAYDAEVISKSLEKSLHISNGRNYLEKVVQASFKVPLAMSYDLRNWLSEEVSLLMDDPELSDDARKRLLSTCHIWSNLLLETPRDIVRVINSLKLNFTPVRGKVDPADMLFLQIIKTKNSDLFSWIENYVYNLSSIGDWGFVSPGTPEIMGKKLLDTLNDNDEERGRFLNHLSEYLPGIDVGSFHKKDAPFKVLSLTSSEELVKYSLEKRLASQHHFSYYFSFSKPSGTVEDSDALAFLDLCGHDPAAASRTFSRLTYEERPQGGRLAQVLLDRINSFRDKVSPEQVEGLFEVLGEHMDTLVRVARADFGQHQFLKGAPDEVFGLIAKVEDDDKRNEILQRLFEESKSIAWLTGIIRELCHEIDRPTEGKNSLLSLLSVSKIYGLKEKFIQRLHDTPFSELIETPHLGSTMFAWNQLGDPKEPDEWVTAHTVSDEDFVALLEKMTHWSVSTTDGVVHRLGRETLDTFFGGSEAVKERLQKIAMNPDTSGDLGMLAANLIGRIDDR